MTISSTPPIEQMTAEDQQRLQVTTEDVQPLNGEVASSAADLVPAEDGYRYRTEPIVGLAKKVRFRSMSTAAYRKHVLNEDGTNDLEGLVQWAVVDGNGHSYLTEADVLDFKNSEKYDLRTWNQILGIAIEHCLGGNLEQLADIAAGN